MLNWLDWILEKSSWFLKLVIYPLITPLFVIINYTKLRDLMKDSGHQDSVWVKIFLVISVAYFLLTFGLGIYWIIKNLKDWKKP